MLTIQPNSVVLQDSLSPTNEWSLFSDPLVVVQTKVIEEVLGCLRTVEAHTKQGRYAVGFISYEAAAAMDPAFQTHASTGFPLLWFGVYENRQSIKLPTANVGAYRLGAWTPSVSFDEYRDAINQIKNHINDGHAYQVNYTFRLRNSFSGDAWEFFLALQESQRSRHCAYANLGRYHICSASPELFFTLDNEKLISKPMKGTIKRGSTTAEDDKLVDWLQTSQKNRAENVMIVDMVRSDMGSIAKTGTVSVEKLFSIEKYPTVLQMTSTVAADVSSSVTDILRGMFPCASITGAPKVKATEIIKNLEKDPRGIYTGSIGYLAPDGKAEFNVAIRTVVVDTKNANAEYGVGGGIVWDSDAQDEYEECKAKAAVLTRTSSAF